MTLPYTVEQHIALKRVASIAPSPDGTWLAVVVQRLDQEGTKYVSDLWKLPTDGGAPVQLTRGDSKDVAPCFRHDGALGFLSNRKPNELKPDDDADQRMQLWLLPKEGGEPRQLTDEPLGVESFKFAARADRLLLFAPVLADVPHEKQRETAAERAKKGPSARRYTRQPVRHWDHWLTQDAERAHTHLILCDAGGGQRVDLTPQATTEFAIEPHLDIAPCGAHALASWATPGADREDDSALLIVDLATRAQRLVPQGANTNTESGLFAPDSRSIVAVRSTRSPKDVVRPTLVLIDVARGEVVRELARDWDRWPLLADWRADGRQLLVTADDEGGVPVYAVDVAQDLVRPLSALPAGGSHAGVAALADGRIAAIRSTLLDAPECVLYEGATAAEPRPLARLSGFVPATDWAETESITTISTDGQPVQSWITRPKGAFTDGARAPTLLWIHGGPIGMSGDGWHWRWNPLLAVAQGYVVVQPNPRGSTGFGQDFVQGIWGNVWGQQCYRDLMAVTDALQSRPEVDGDRLMAMGGSFGGYMTNWIGTQTDRFRCLITHASICTMAQFTGTTDHPAWWYLEMGGENPYADPAGYDRHAPIRHVAQWKTPTLILHGEKDYRCPVSEGLNLFEALQYHGVDSELVIFPDENHWILKPRNIVAWYDHVLAFLGKHLR